jgi:hypothetical protein
MQSLGETEPAGFKAEPAAAIALAKLSQYMQSTQAAALKAADAQARVQKFLADKIREPYATATLPKTPVVLKRSMYEPGAHEPARAHLNARG